MPVEAKPLFRPDSLRPLLKSFEEPEDFATKHSIVQKWASLFESEKSNSFREQELLADFVSDIFCGVLGYERPADNPSRYTRAREKYLEVDGKFADAVLGVFGEGQKSKPVVAVEGKGPKDPLERPFAGRKKSAVDQGYGYAINLPCDWIIVTSMRETRLYHKGSDQQTYERFDIDDLAENELTLKKFIFLLGADRVVPINGECHFDALKASSEKIGRTLTKKFYLEYADIRQDVFEQLCEENPDRSRHAILSATQKLLDRVLFAAFCEDRGLLPKQTLKNAFEHSDPYNPRPIWTNFRGLFSAIDKGNPNLNIPPYNGGLFADDPFLENLTVPDAVCSHFFNLGEYEYRPATEVASEDTDEQAGLIDVEILGHIFEQSITDLEQIRNELDGLVAPVGKEKHKTRRKKEGAFYTPEFITRYIVEQSLGPVLNNRFEHLRSRLASEASGTAAKALADPSVYDLAILNKPQRESLTAFWEHWQEELTTIRILDPACGSGAFLIEAFDQLHTAYQHSNERLEELRGQRSLFDLDRRILQNNLFGVDLNAEAVQICRLSLWIKTAERGKTLTALDDSIQVGNSVVDDFSVHPNAFDWKAGYPDIFADGGFDVVVGNPPYIRQEWLAEYKPHWEKRFESYSGTADIFTYFFELATTVTRPGGRFGFITSGSWIRGKFGAALRRFLANHSKIESIVDFGEYQPFEGAEMIRPSIVVGSMGTPDGNLSLFKWLTNGKPPTNLSTVIAEADEMDVLRLREGVWELETERVAGLKEKLFASGRSLKEYAGGSLLYGIKTGLNQAYILDDETRKRLIEQDSRSQHLIKPFLRGQDIRHLHGAWKGIWMLCLKSSSDFAWPWADAGVDAESVFAENYPAIHAHVKSYESRLRKRSDQGKYWWELRSCAYWDMFEQEKILWPDICKKPRFFMDPGEAYIGDTAFMVAQPDYFLLGVLNSWATWFSISKTAQPLRLRGDRWQYRLKKQWLEALPIPDANEGQKDEVASLSKIANSIGKELYETQESVRRRLLSSFGENSDGTITGKLNNKATQWWHLTLNQLGASLKTSFKLKQNPFLNPNIADQWEAYTYERGEKIHDLTKRLSATEATLNAKVYELFRLTDAEVALLEKEVEH